MSKVSISEHLLNRGDRPLISGDGSFVKPDKYLEMMRKELTRARKEKRIPEFFQTPVGAQLELTPKCNQRCITCYNRSGDTEFHDEKPLTVQEWLGVAKQVRELKPFELIFSGGEPLLLKDGLFEIMDVFKDMKPIYVLISNGILMNEAAVERLRQYTYGWIQISIDGVTPEIHDYIRQAPGSWEKAVRAVQLLRDAGLPVIIAHTVTRQNLETLPDMIDYAYYAGANRIMVGEVIESGRAIINHEEICLNKADQQRFYNIVSEKTKQYAGTFSIMSGAGTSYSLRYTRVMGNRTILIRPNGDVKLDCSLPFKIGNVREEPIAKMWQERGWRAYEAPNVLAYTKKIKRDADVMEIYPRPYVDKDVLVDKLN